MDKITAVFTLTASSPWWLFPGLDVMQECFSCWLVGQSITAPLGIAVAFAIAYVIGE
mgnify:CR=1 FL=1|tara:strand:+ start:5942 stop:6112 length:171 start_codon:yes stop_codon:yes gene_type:complete